MNKAETSILLVEDEPVLQFVFERQLQKLGYKVARVVDDGLAAVEAVVAQPYHLVFMDVRLPGVDGMTATKRIRKIEAEKARHTKIVGLTSFSERQRCLESGMDDFLQKPVLIEQLGETVEKWLNHPSSTDIIPYAEDLQRTAVQLTAIQSRIANLRKQLGLEDAEAGDTASSPVA